MKAIKIGFLLTAVYLCYLAFGGTPVPSAPKSIIALSVMLQHCV